MATFGALIYCNYGVPALGIGGTNVMRWRVKAWTGSLQNVRGPTVGMSEDSDFPGNYYVYVPDWDSTWVSPVALVDDQSGLAGAAQVAKVIEIVNVVTVDGAQVLQVGDPAITQNIFIASAATVLSPVDPSDDDRLTLVHGDDYDVAGSIPSWSISGYTGPSLAGGTGKLRLVPQADYDRLGSDATAQLVVDATIVQTGTDLAITAPITSVQVLTLSTTPPGDETTHTYQLVGITSGGKSRTLRLSPATVRRRVKP